MPEGTQNCEGAHAGVAGFGVSPEYIFKKSQPDSSPLELGCLSGVWSRPQSDLQAAEKLSMLCLGSSQCTGGGNDGVLLDPKAANIFGEDNILGLRVRIRGVVVSECCLEAVNFNVTDGLLQIGYLNDSFYIKNLTLDFNLDALKANRVRFQVGSLPDFSTWESCRTMSLISGLSRGSPVSPARAFRSFSILTSFHTHRLLKTSDVNLEGLFGGGDVGDLANRILNDVALDLVLDYKQRIISYATGALVKKANAFLKGKSIDDLGHLINGGVASSAPAAA
ncbi:hypothetical protein PR048_027186 [Dryococelus australis]|uniref:Uncharacterized protein n=1 Tax=Dryococelus australis TaxID=614101 RepID=A0ABQ9GER3_9NEOP|nr:hypothetical protein PR048_027186 [Dryococelus australis]